MPLTGRRLLTGATLAGSGSPLDAPLVAVRTSSPQRNLSLPVLCNAREVSGFPRDRGKPPTNPTDTIPAMPTPAPTINQWIAGARPRTLPAAVAPVLAGTAVALWVDQAVWWKAALALLVSLLLQIGVNYANDYSDGIRGTDEDRVGPLRLVGSGTATPRAVKTAAFAALGAAALVGLVLAATTAWWLVGRRAALHPRRLVLHRRIAPLRLPRARRGDGLRLLRPGRGAGHDVRPDRDLRAPRAVRRHRGGCLRLRHPGGEQPARHPHRPGLREAHPRGRARRGTHPPALRTPRRRRRWWLSSGSR